MGWREGWDHTLRTQRKEAGQRGGKGEAREGTLTALPMQKVAGHTSVPFTAEMPSTKLGNPNHTIDRTVIPKGESGDALYLLLMQI